MPREDNLSSRFDYLFEPLDVEESVDDGDTARGRWNGASDKDETPGNAAPVRIAFAAFVLASLVAVAVVAVLLLQQPNQTQDPVNSPAEPSPMPTTVTEVPSQVAAVAPPPPTPADSEAAQTVESVPTQQAVPESPPTQTPPPRAPRGEVKNSPSTRAPISVAPESRPAFPNQGPRTGGSGGGGLLGGLL
jgi:hypothetical protein